MVSFVCGLFCFVIVCLVFFYFLFWMTNLYFSIFDSTVTCTHRMIFSNYIFDKSIYFISITPLKGTKRQ